MFFNLCVSLFPFLHMCTCVIACVFVCAFVPLDRVTARLCGSLCPQMDLPFQVARDDCSILATPLKQGGSYWKKLKSGGYSWTMVIRKLQQHPTFSLTFLYYIPKAIKRRLVIVLGTRESKLHKCDRTWEKGPLRAQYDFSVQAFLV